MGFRDQIVRERSLMVLDSDTLLDQTVGQTGAELSGACGGSDPWKRFWTGEAGKQELSRFEIKRR